MDTVEPTPEGPGASRRPPGPSRLGALRRRHPRLVRLLLLLAAVALPLGALECGTRLVVRLTNPEAYRAVTRELSRAEDGLDLFRPHPHLVYARSDTRFIPEGLDVGGQFLAIPKPEDVVRVACLGASTTRGKYPEHLPKLLRVPEGQRLEVLDFGVDGWTVQETLINYAIRADLTEPDVVLMHHGANDAHAAVTAQYLPDLEHYRRRWAPRDGALVHWLGLRSFALNMLMRRLDATPNDLYYFVARTEPLPGVDPGVHFDPVAEHVRRLKLLAALVNARGARLILAPMASNPAHPNALKIISALNQATREVAGELHLPLAESHQDLSARPELFEDWVHLRPEGVRLKAELFAPLIQAELDQMDPKPRAGAEESP